MTDYSTAAVGAALPEVVFGPVTRTTLALYAGASGDHNPIHVDIDFARKAGLDDVFAHGMLSMAELARVVTDWAGLDRLVSLSTRFLAITPVGATVTCRGKVVERFESDGVPHLRVSLTAEIGEGTRSLAGEAVVRAA